MPELATAQFLRGGGMRQPFGGGFGISVLPGIGGGFPLRPRPPPEVEIEPEPEVVEMRRPRRRVVSHSVPAQARPRKAVRQSAAPPRVLPPKGPLDPTDVMGGDVLVVLKPGLTPADLTALIRRHRLTSVSVTTFTLIPATVQRFRFAGRRSVASVVAALAADPRVLSAQPNHLYGLMQGAAPSELAGAQYAVAALHLPAAHRLATGRGVEVAMIDAAVDVRHPALAGSVAAQFDALEADTPTPPHPHGTAIAGLIAAHGGLDSPAPDTHLLAIRAFADPAPQAPAAEGTTLPLLRALDWAASHHARVVNMSFAGPADALLARFLAAGSAAGAIYVAAAGNAGPASPPLYPAADPHVIAVTATDGGERLFASANRGAFVTLAAPGVDVVVLQPNDGYNFASGTSMAAAQVSGIVAAMLQIDPALTPDEAREALRRSAKVLRAAEAGGVGLADAEGALKAVMPPAPASVSEAKEAPAR